MSKIRTGDRVWVRTPRVLAERKVGTITRVMRTSKGLRYLVEWETNLVEQPNGHHPGYRAREIVSISKRTS